MASTCLSELDFSERRIDSILSAKPLFAKQNGSGLKKHCDRNAHLA